MGERRLVGFRWRRGTFTGIPGLPRERRGAAGRGNPHARNRRAGQRGAGPLAAARAVYGLDERHPILLEKRRPDDARTCTVWRFTVGADVDLAAAVLAQPHYAGLRRRRCRWNFIG